MLEMVKKAHDGAIWQLIPTPNKVQDFDWFVISKFEFF